MPNLCYQRLKLRSISSFNFLIEVSGFRELIIVLPTITKFAPDEIALDILPP